MADQLLTPQQAASRLGVSVTTLYDWLGRSTAGLLVVSGERISIDYFQTGARQQGRIRIPADEIDRLLELMRVRPVNSRPRPRLNHAELPGITVKLGKPD